VLLAANHDAFVAMLGMNNVARQAESLKDDIFKVRRQNALQQRA
jgi:hypothetical protein